MQPRPTMLSQQLPKQIVGSQPILQQTQLAQAPKVIMTQAVASPVIQAAPTTTTISTTKLSTPFWLNLSIFDNDAFDYFILGIFILI